MSENPYSGFNFNEAQAAIVGGIRREDVEAVRATARFFLRRFEGERCDSDGVSDCVRCNAVFIAKRMLMALESVPTVSELARAHALQAEGSPEAAGSEGEAEAPGGTPNKEDR